MVKTNTSKNIYVNIAGFVIKICFHQTNWFYSKNKLQQDIVSHYRNFLLEKQTTTPDSTINVVWNKEIGILILRKRRYFSPLYYFKGLKQVECFYHISLVEFNFVMAGVLNRLLAEHKGFFIHASAIINKDGATLFLGKPEAGKSTVIKLLKEEYQVIADDTMIIKKEKGEFYCYQTPFIDKEVWVKKLPEKYRLKQLLILKKANYFNKTKIANKGTLFKKLIDSKKIEKKAFKKQIPTIFQFIEEQEFYNLFFDKKKNLLTSFFKEKDEE